MFHSSEIGAFINLMLTADECELFCHGRQTTPAEELIPNEGLEQLPVKMLYIRSLAETHQRGLSWQRLMTLIPLSDFLESPGQACSHTAAQKMATI